MSTTVRVSDETHERLVALADATGRRMHAIVDDAVAAYESSMFWEEFSAGYERLAADPIRWTEVQAERAGEAPSLGDGTDGS
jgi:predicted DNA-binding protein